MYAKHPGELVDGEKWGIVKLCLLPDDNSKGDKTMFVWLTLNHSNLIVLLI